jgi:hypothetical protein
MIKADDLLISSLIHVKGSFLITDGCDRRKSDPALHWARTIVPTKQLSNPETHRLQWLRLA